MHRHTCKHVMPLKTRLTWIQLSDIVCALYLISIFVLFSSKQMYLFKIVLDTI